MIYFKSCNLKLKIRIELDLLYFPTFINFNIFEKCFDILYLVLFYLTFMNFSTDMLFKKT